MQCDVPGGVCCTGGSVGRLPEELQREVAYIAYHLHWSRREILEMTHRERSMWVSRVNEINAEILERTRRLRREFLEQSSPDYS
ncbi:hypothetical protein SAMN05920897_1212 [Alkalispirochaeta americana]|uniref:DUF6760 domain-containing protein n=1 Tax=Alkalispirochaeta americana TaxID=159291 RepID=A0A1N6X784_9SPIO|nr:DUF6760 family protein [Alkalispirochaeta americana]SIQ98173.1 hypothetical protein SAMN05920897_1212 [Alkalispirochaeta americana]